MGQTANPPHRDVRRSCAEAKFGFSVNGYGIGDLVKYVNEASEEAVTKLCSEYEERYTVGKELRTGGARHQSLRDGARESASFIELLQARCF